MADPTIHPEDTRRGLMLVLSSPSGAGKTTLSRRLLDVEQDLMMSVSATTRPPRPGEEDGRDYFFLSPERFEAMIGEDAFLEHAQVFGNRYGTPREFVERTLGNGRDILFDIDWQGTQILHQKMRDDLVRVFILPPSIDELHRRLKERNQDSDEVVARRMAKAAGEISHWAEYDYVLINRDLNSCLTQLRAILQAERLRRSRRPQLAGFVNALLETAETSAG